MDFTKKVAHWVPMAFLATVLLQTTSVSGNVDGQICTDVSYWKPVEYKPVEYKCCSSKVELNCLESEEKVCIPVEEMECQIIGWSDCQMYPCPVEVKKPKIITEDFIEQTCDMVPHNITHIKKIPECKNVTKRICTTLWDRDAQGNPVWKSEEDCKDVTWLKCDDKEVPAVIPTMKSKCRPGNELPYQTCTNDTMVETHMCQRCTPKAASSCKVVKKEDCVQVTLKSCQPKITEDCPKTPYNIPYQEFVHQDKCLFDEFGNAHHGDDPNAGEHGPSHHHKGSVPKPRGEDGRTGRVAQTNQRNRNGILHLTQEARRVLAARRNRTGQILTLPQLDVHLRK